MISLKNSICALLLAFSFNSSVKADENLEKERMMAELDSIKTILDHQYAPQSWKKEYLGWDLNKEIAIAKNRVINTQGITIKKFHEIVRDFFRTTKDYHVGVHFYSTESAFLPFEVKSAEGKYFISYVYEDQLPYSSYPIFTGDEVLEFNDRPIAEVVDELQITEFGNIEPGTDRELTLMYLTRRNGESGQIIPRGPITLKLNQAMMGQRSYQLIWSYTPEKIINQSLSAKAPARAVAMSRKTAAIISTKAPKVKPQDFNKSWMTPYFKTDLGKLEEKLMQFAKAKLENKNIHDEDEEVGEDASPHQLGNNVSFVPQLGKIWWENKGFYHAYIFETEDHRLMGYLRIPHYADFEFMGFSLSELLFIPELRKILSLFEERTEGLVIDQVNNPGGSVFFLYAIASLLTDKPLVTPKHRMVLTAQDIANANIIIPKLEAVENDEEAKEAITDLFGNLFNCNDVNYEMSQFILEFCRFSIEQWREGKVLTDPYYIYGVDHINPDRQVNYTKPILFLINHLDFSGGDFLPAILQDNKRVKLFGSQTAGAGGYVLGHYMNSRNGIIGFMYTASIAERVSGQPIENLGVTPEIPYKMTENDLKYDYVDYKAAILDNL
jgi:hypothetical protein